ncbi:hypothetical protein EVAR_3899_1 [Eumeta japonica]|uniref:Uncharacterized protein n=1 Tax=Eumeta variegata TaxID=151549 RepID=A0A4C1SQX0_EUMVA|nr:hypothetical protein EVAR_3899_1 [Eumeta japonica]
MDKNQFCLKLQHSEQLLRVTKTRTTPGKYMKRADNLIAEQFNLKLSCGQAASPSNFTSLYIIIFCPFLFTTVCCEETCSECGDTAAGACARVGESHSCLSS